MNGGDVDMEITDKLEAGMSVGSCTMHGPSPIPQEGASGSHIYCITPSASKFTMLRGRVCLMGVKWITMDNKIHK